MKELPSAWAQVTLGDMTEYVTSGSRDWSQYYAETGALFVRTQDINTNKLADLGSMAKVRLPISVEGKRTLIRKDDLLITITGANVGRCAHVIADLPEAYVSQSVALVRLLDPSLARFVHLQLLSPIDNSGKTSLEARAYGMGRPVLNLDNVRETPVLVPPRQEQQRIAAKLDAVLTRVDAVNTRLARVAPILKRFRQSVLAAAASGVLSADVNGGNWPKPVDLGAYCEVLGGKRLPKGSQLSGADTGFPYVRVTDFYNFSVKVDQVKFVPIEAVNTIARYIIRAVDVYISIAGSIGLVGRVPQYLDGANLTENAARIVVGPEVSPSFLMYQLGSPQLQSEMHEKKIATTQDKLGLFRIKALQVCIPPLIEQTEIVRRVESLFAFADRLEARLQTAQTATERLTPALLAKAFRGELVPQDPRDEPASELLRRLQQEAPSTSTKRGRKSAA
jgi:type I restriction enzyme S subunit